MGSPSPKKHAAEFRRKTADYAISTGRPIKQVARECGVKPGNWVCRRKRELNGEAPAGPSAGERELREAKKRIRELETGNGFPRRAAAFFAKDHA